MALWGAIAGFAGLVSLGFFVGAIYVWLSNRYDSLTACLILGGIFAFLALLAVAVAFILKRRAERASAQQMMLAAAEIASLGAAVTRSFKGANGKYYVLGAIAAGWILSKTMRR